MGLSEEQVCYQCSPFLEHIYLTNCKHIQTLKYKSVYILILSILGPAIADEDYSSSTLEVVFTSGGSDIQYVDIPIEDDAIFENTEHLYAHLSLAPGSPGGVIDPNKATIFIEEMKGKCNEIICTSV